MRLLEMTVLYGDFRDAGAELSTWLVEQWAPTLVCNPLIDRVTRCALVERAGCDDGDDLAGMLALMHRLDDDEVVRVRQILDHAGDRLVAHLNRTQSALRAAEDFTQRIARGETTYGELRAAYDLTVPQCTTIELALSCRGDCASGPCAAPRCAWRLAWIEGHGLARSWLYGGRALYVADVVDGVDYVRAEATRRWLGSDPGRWCALAALAEHWEGGVGELIATVDALTR